MEKQTTNLQKIKLKLVIDKNRGKVLFAEVDSTFVDFLIYLLSLPLSAVGAYLPSASPGSIGKLRQNLQKLDESHYIKQQSTSSASSILVPHLLTHVPFLPRLTGEINKPVDKIFYLCTNFTGCMGELHGAMTDVEKSICRFCNGQMNRKGTVSYTSLQTRPAKYVEDKVKYIVSDELSVSPMDSAAVIDAIKGCDGLMEKYVEFGHQQALEMMKAVVLQSEKVLTGVFLKPE